MAALNFEVKSATEAWLPAYKAYQRAGVRLTMLWMHHTMVYRTRNRQPAAYEVDTGYIGRMHAVAAAIVAMLHSNPSVKDTCRGWRTPTLIDAYEEIQYGELRWWDADHEPFLPHQYIRVSRRPRNMWIWNPAAARAALAAPAEVDRSTFLADWKRRRIRR